MRNIGMLPFQEDIRTRIIESSRDHFLRNGFSKVTVDEIAHDLGISKKTVYQHFRSKDEILDSVVEWKITQIGGGMTAIMNSPADFIDKLQKMWIHIGETVCQLSRQFIQDLQRFRPDLWKRVERVRAEIIMDNFTRLVDDGIRLGFIREDVDKNVVVLMYLNAVQGIINPDVLVRHSFSHATALRTIMRVLLEGILTDTARQHFRQRITNA